MTIEELTQMDNDEVLEYINELEDEIEDLIDLIDQSQEE